MDINLSKARRAEKIGLIKDATTYEQNAQTNKIAAFKANKQAQQLGLSALAQAAMATRAAAPRAGIKESDAVQAQKAFAVERANPDDPEAKRVADAWREALSLTRPGPISAGISATAMGERSAAEIAADEEKQRKDIAEKRDAARLELERTVAAEYTGTKLALEPEYLEALRNAGKNVPGAKTPNQVRLEIIAREVERRAGAQPSAKGSGAGAGAGGAAGKKPDISAVEGAPAGSTVGGFVQGKGYKVLDSKGNHIGFVQ
jgi:hypothetical protein